jgi:hypothetical protein
MVIYDLLLSIKQKYQAVIMKDSEVKVLDENDYIFIKALSNLGMSRNVATAGISYECRRSFVPGN